MTEGKYFVLACLVAFAGLVLAAVLYGTGIGREIQDDEYNNRRRR